jgi:hypothetical protein
MNVLEELRRMYAGIGEAIRALEGAQQPKPAPPIQTPTPAELYPRISEAIREAAAPEIINADNFQAYKGKRHYGGKHWTQTPAGRARMRRIQRKAHADKRAREAQPQ